MRDVPQVRLDNSPEVSEQEDKEVREEQSFDQIVSGIFGDTSDSGAAVEEEICDFSSPDSVDRGGLGDAHTAPLHADLETINMADMAW